MSAAEEVTEHAEKAAHGVKGALTKRIGPLPAGVWILAIAGGLVVAYFVRGQANSDIAADEYAEAAEEALSEAEWDTADPGGTAGGVGGGGAVPVTPSTPSEPDNGVPGAAPRHGHVWKAKHAKTNADWRHHAVLAMAARGYRTGVVNETLGDYLAGRRMTAAQAAVAGATMALCGPPPKAPKRQQNVGGGGGTTAGHGQSHGHAGTRDNGGNGTHNGQHLGSEPRPADKPHKPKKKRRHPLATWTAVLQPNVAHLPNQGGHHNPPMPTDGAGGTPTHGGR